MTKDQGQSQYYHDKSSPVRQVVKSRSLEVKWFQGPLLQMDGYRTTARKEQV